ncbi:phytoene/squalene synthase family protein [Vulcaniibacterium tengchongense]|uniref:Phytoene/squalene synthetase n=1 Tax=Vulcaniibacterium tengchongense TaxID=1273429 RepID=A0A3N4VKU7_9GAMM|nr:phytoene/squalene synthase family protein [Vulcaniibacterium tengchongense]RPE82045.1 hypothetical protein EDC50_1249 [Vulcaniibacterium tengchongense]
MTDDSALDSFIDKWRARWPEWAVAEAFVPKEQRAVALAWAALLQELTDAAWGGTDPRPGEAKLGWWAEELQGWAQGARRHPLGAALQRRPAPWVVLAAALPALRDSRERPRDREEAFAALAPVAEAVAAVEAALFAAPDDAAAPAAIGAGLLHARLATSGEAAAPLSVLARAQAGEGATIWAAELLQYWPRRAAVSRPRALWAELAASRLRRGDAARPLPAWSALRAAWRGARRSPGAGA